MEAVNQVWATKDYSIFSQIGGNRIVNELHVERLKKSFQVEYLLSPIQVNELMQIIDGQHRFAAAKAMNLPVYFIIIKGYGLKEIQILNSNMKNWDKMDYLHAYCDQGRDEYLKFQKFMSDFPDFGIAICERLITNTAGGTNKGYAAKINGRKSGRLKYFEDGNLEIPDLEMSYENARKIMSFKPYFPLYNNATFVSAMIGIFKNKNYNHNQMINKLKNNPSKLKKEGDVTNYKIRLEEVYNYRSQEKVSLRF